MLFTVYGNCQSKALAESLLCFESFSKIYKYEKVKPVQDIVGDEVASVFDCFRKCDLFIEQVVSDSYRIPEVASSKLALFKKPYAQTIKFPSIYFGGVFPSFFSIPMKSILGFNHCYIILKSFILDVPKNKLINSLKSKYLFMHEESVALFEHCLSELKRREIENEVDLTVSDFILSNYKDNALFDTMNHPRSYIFQELSNNIVSSLGIKGGCSNFDDFNPYLGNVKIYPYYSTKCNLDLSYVLEEFPAINGELLSIDELVDRFYYDYGNTSLSLETLLEKIKNNNVIILDRVVDRVLFDA